MAQTGDPTGTGMGGSGTNLRAEFTDYAYIEGTVGMARSMNPNSADSQFFICFEGCGHLTGQYTVWGQVTDGMDVVRKINEGQPPAEPDEIISADERLVGKLVKDGCRRLSLWSELQNKCQPNQSKGRHIHMCEGF